MGDKSYEKCCPAFEKLPHVPLRSTQYYPSMKRRSLYTSLIFSIQVIDDIASSMSSDHHDFLRTLGHDFSVTQLSCSDHGEGTMVHVFKTWLKGHEEAQVMLASVLVVIGLWWLVRTVLTLLINLICPLLVVLLAVVSIYFLKELGS